MVTLGKNQLLANAGRVLARVSKAATQGSDEKPQQIDLTKLGGTLLTSCKSKRTGDRYQLWQFSVAGNDHRTIKLIHADYGETWTAYHPDYHPVFAPASVQQASEKPKSFSFAAYLPHRCCLLCKRDPFVIKKSHIYWPFRTLPEWRNWQTRRIQNPVRAISCGFESHLRY